MKEIFLAGGCFWGMQKYFDNVVGVLNTQVGYANGIIPNPSYDDVCCGNTNFAETIWLRYDESVIDLNGILELYFNVINPTVKNRQGNDVGTQYRTGIYYIDESDLPVIKAFAAREQEKYQDLIVTEIMPLRNYYAAEGYHQKYLERNPNGYCHIGKEVFQYAGTYRQLQPSKR